MPEDIEALRMLARSGLPSDTQRELYELYAEDCEEHSRATALENLDSAIKDAQQEAAVEA